MKTSSQTNINAARLLTLVAVFAACWGLAFGWARNAFAQETQSDRVITLTEVSINNLEEPEIGATPKRECKFTVLYSNKQIYNDPLSTWTSDPIADNADQNATWFCGEDTTFVDGHQYTVKADVTYYLNSNYHDSFDASNATAYVNGEQKGKINASAVNGNYWQVSISCDWTLHGLTLNANGGTGDDKTQTTYEEYSVSLKKNDDYTKFTKTGQKFAGWNTKADGSGKHYDDGADYSYDAEVNTLYAEWTPETYTITFVNDDGTELQSGQVAYNETPTYTGETPTKKETDEATYKFKGWTPEIVPATQDATYKATYDEVKKVKATLTFDLAGGTLDGKTDTYTITATVGETIKLPKAPTRDGYTFKCWKGSEYKAEEEYKVEGDHTFTAEWEKEMYTIVFDANGGEGTMDDLVVEPGTKTNLPENKFTRDGYTFTGWNTEKDGSGKSYADKAAVEVVGNETLYAQWKKSTASSSGNAAKSNASGTSSTSGKSSTSSTAKTGDATSFVSVALVAISGAGAVVAGLKRRR